MPTEFRLPDLGEDTSEGEVVKVLVKPGDTVRANQPVIELETDKALLEVPSPSAGRIASVSAAVGKKLHVNDLILVIEEEEGDSAAAARSGKSSDGGKAAKNVEERPPDSPIPLDRASKQPAPLPPREAPPRPESSSPLSPNVAQPARPPRPGEGGPPAVTPAEDEDAESRESARVLDVPPPSSAGSKAVISAPPATRKLARELGVDLAAIRGSGPQGRITSEDVRAHVKQRVGGSGGGPASRIAAPPLPDFSRWGEIERQPMSGIRKRTLEHMALSWNLIPHVTQVDEADITDLMALRERHAKQAAEKGGKLTVTVFVLKAVISALKAYPQVNASVDPEREEIILKRYYHIGIAVDTGHGLVVPVIRDVDKKSLLDISAELLTVSDRARERKIKLDELKGSTFTITNLGGLGGTAFTPIIHYPEVAILGLARTQKRLVMTPDGIGQRSILPLCLSYDHRVIDGADAVRFTRKIAAMLEDPALLLLEG